MAKYPPKNRLPWHSVALSGLIALASASGAWSRPAVFSDYSLDQARQQAQQDGKLLLIDFTAAWCPPCKKMESETWGDDAVQAWIKENAIAVQIDVDEGEKTAAAMKVEAMPTLVLFTPKSGAGEFGRQVGFVAPAELLQWLEGAKSGKSADELEKEQSQAGDGAIWERIGKCRELLAAGKYDEALEQYVWLWTNIKTGHPTLGDLRTSMLPVEFKQLGAVHPPAKLKVAQMRDAADRDGNRQDWIILNGVLDDNARTLAWFDKAKTDPKEHAAIQRLGPFLEPVLFSNTRWADAAKYLYPDPLAKLNEYYKRAQDMKKPRPHTEVAKDFDPFPSMVLLLYAAYIGAGRDADAQKIEDECLRLDDTPAMRDGLGNMAKTMRAARAAQNKTTR